MTALGIDGDFVTVETFPLPTLRLILQDLCDEVHDGKGFFVLRGLDPMKYTVEDGMVIFLGIQAYIAEQRARQDDEGNMIGTYQTYLREYLLLTSNSSHNFRAAHDVFAWK